MTLCMTLYILFHVLFVYFIFVLLLFTVHLCAIDTRFHKCNLLTNTAPHNKCVWTHSFVSNR